MSTGSRPRAYRFLLLFFPRRVREQFGAEMQALFEQQLTRTRGISRLRLWIRAILDAARHGVGERLDQWQRQRRQPMRRWWMGMFEHDVRYAFRLLARQRATTAMVVLTLALGIGANTAVFSVVHAVLLRPLPYEDPASLVMVWEKRAAEGVDTNFVSPADFLDWSRMNSSFATMAALGQPLRTADLTGVGDPVQLPVAAVSASFFDVLGVRAGLGRTFAVGEDILGQHRLIVLSHGLWLQRFGGDTDVIGRTVVLNGVSHEIIGVLRRDFEFPGERPSLWVPLVLGGDAAAPPRAAHFLAVYARLKRGVSLDLARADMVRVADQLSADYPENVGHGAHVVPLREEIVAPARTGLLIVMGAVAFLLLIACTNVANLLLARSAGRRRELAVRSALGAARSRLLRQSFTESLVVSVLGGAAGLVVAWWTLHLLIAETPPALRGAGLGTRHPRCTRAAVYGPRLPHHGRRCRGASSLAGVAHAAE